MALTQWYPRALHLCRRFPPPFPVDGRGGEELPLRRQRQHHGHHRLRVCVRRPRSADGRDPGRGTARHLHPQRPRRAGAEGRGGRDTRLRGTRRRAGSPRRGASNRSREDSVPGAGIGGQRSHERGPGGFQTGRGGHPAAGGSRASHRGGGTGPASGPAGTGRHAVANAGTKLSVPDRRPPPKFHPTSAQCLLPGLGGPIPVHCRCDLGAGRGAPDASSGAA